MVRLECDALLLDFAEFGQTINLKTARIGQNAAVPMHKAV